MIDTEKIKTTIEVLATLDSLQRSFYTKTLEPQLRSDAPHSDSMSLQIAKKAIHNFVAMSPMGNGQGLDMHCSAFIEGLYVINMDTEAEAAILAHQKL